MVFNLNTNRGTNLGYNPVRIKSSNDYPLWSRFKVKFLISKCTITLMVNDIV